MIPSPLARPVHPPTSRRGPRYRFAVGVLALGAGVVATGCGASGGGGDGSGSGDGAPTTTVSPLGQLMGWTNESPEESRRKQLKVEQLVAECMREEGWEYKPVDYAAQEQASTSPDAELQMTDPVAFGEKHGYGVAFYYELYEEANIGTGERGSAAPVGTAPGMADPNADYVEGLSKSEQDEYYASLYGKPMTDESGEFSSSAATAIKPEDQGCYGVSSVQVYPQNGAANDPDVQDRMNDYWENQQKSPELLAAYEDWAACLAEQVDLVGPSGEPIANPNGMYTYVDALKNEALGLTSEAVTSEDLDKGNDDYYTASMDENGKGVAWSGTPSKISETDLAELSATEVKLWKIDHSCQDDARIAEVQMEAEEKFVDELVAEFPELTGGAT